MRSLILAMLMLVGCRDEYIEPIGNIPNKDLSTNQFDLSSDLSNPADLAKVIPDFAKPYKNRTITIVGFRDAAPEALRESFYGGPWSRSFASCTAPTICMFRPSIATHSGFHWQIPVKKGAIVSFTLKGVAQWDSDPYPLYPSRIAAGVYVGTDMFTTDYLLEVSKPTSSSVFTVDYTSPSTLINATTFRLSIGASSYFDVRPDWETKIYISEPN